MKLALIGTFYRRWERTELLLRRVYLESTRPPDEFWLMCEDWQDATAAQEALDRIGIDPPGLEIYEWPTPRSGDSYAVIPYSNKINRALDLTTADAIVYLDNGSTPHPRKYELMLEQLEANPDYGAVYCSYNCTGFKPYTWEADHVIQDAYCKLNYTQVMHRPTEDRWTLDMEYAKPYDLADALFWRALHRTLGPFYPVPSDDWLDEHHIEGFQAVGL